MSLGLSNEEKILIKINPDTGTYKVDISFCSLQRLESVLEDLLDQIKSKEILNQPDLETISLEDTNNGTTN